MENKERKKHTVKGPTMLTRDRKIIDILMRQCSSLHESASMHKMLYNYT